MSCASALVMDEHSVKGASASLTECTQWLGAHGNNVDGWAGVLDTAFELFCTVVCHDFDHVGVWHRCCGADTRRSRTGRRDKLHLWTSWSSSRQVLSFPAHVTNTHHHFRTKARRELLPVTCQTRGIRFKAWTGNKEKNPWVCRRCDT